MDTKLITALACGAALVLGACSGSTASRTTGEGGDQTGGVPDPDGTGGSNGDGEPTPLQTAETRYSDAQRAATRAVEAARLAAAADTEAARANAQSLIGLASGCIPFFVEPGNSALSCVARVLRSGGCNRGLRGSAWIGPGAVSEDPRTAGAAPPGREQQRSSWQRRYGTRSSAIRNWRRFCRV